MPQTTLRRGAGQPRRTTTDLPFSYLYPQASSVRQAPYMEKYRTTVKRFWAGFIDGLVFLPLPLINPVVWNANLPMSWLVTWMLFSNSAFLLYSVLMHGFYGQTLG